MKEAHEVGVDNVLILLSLDVDPVAVICDAGIVHKNIDVLAELVNSCLNEVLAVLVFAYVSSYNECLNAVLAADLCSKVVRKSL